jgi:hypothetical protein
VCLALADAADGLLAKRKETHHEASNQLDGVDGRGGERDDLAGPGGDSQRRFLRLVGGGVRPGDRVLIDSGPFLVAGDRIESKLYGFPWWDSPLVMEREVPIVGRRAQGRVRPCRPTLIPWVCYGRVRV